MKLNLIIMNHQNYKLIIILKYYLRQKQIKIKDNRTKTVEFIANCVIKDL